MAALLSGCASAGTYVWVDELPPQRGPVRIQDGDRISVQVKNQTPLSGEFLVRANGAYLQPVVGEVAVAGLTAEEAAKRLAKRLDGIVVKPLVSISITTPRTLRVTVIGEVRAPGQYELPRPEGVIGALARAGGLSEFAASDGVYVLRDNPKRQRIRFRYPDLTSGLSPSADFMLRDGDVVIVE